jgi:hypothetical protein
MLHACNRLVRVENVPKVVKTPADTRSFGIR